MNIQLRPPNPRIHPLAGPATRRMLAGLRGLGADVTMTSPSGLVTTGITDYVSTTASNPTTLPNFSTPATYVAPTLVSTPACASGPANTADSAACQQQLINANNQNLALANSANYDVDLQNCQNAWQENDAAYTADGITGPANTCTENTFGLTYVGGYTDSPDTLTPNAQQLVTGSGPTGSITGGGTSSTGSNQPASSNPTLSFTNLTSGNNSSFNVGDRWTIQITGAAPNASVTVTGGQNGASSTATMGTTDSTGSWVYNGTMTAAQVGSWSEAWSVGGTPIQSFTFVVQPTTQTQAATGQSTTGNQLPSNAPQSTDANGVTCATASMVNGVCPAAASTDTTMLIGLGIAAVVLIMVMK